MNSSRRFSLVMELSDCRQQLSCCSPAARLTTRSSCREPLVQHARHALYQRPYQRRVVVRAPCRYTCSSLKSVNDYAKAIRHLSHQYCNANILEIGAIFVPFQAPDLLTEFHVNPPDGRMRSPFCNRQSIPSVAAALCLYQSRHIPARLKRILLVDG